MAKTVPKKKPAVNTLGARTGRTQSKTPNISSIPKKKSDSEAVIEEPDAFVTVTTGENPQPDIVEEEEVLDESTESLGDEETEGDELGGDEPPDTLGDEADDLLGEDPVPKQPAQTTSAPPTKAWYAVGSDGVQKAEKVAKEQDRKFGPPRMWLSVKEDGKFTFLDDDGFFFWEHNLKIRGNWGNFFTCRQDLDGAAGCPLDADFNPYFACAFTVIDHRKIKTKRGVTQHVKRLVVAKRNSFSKIMRAKKDAGGLSFKYCSMARDNDKECNTGEYISVVKTVTPELLMRHMPTGEDKATYLKPFDYREVFEPYDREYLMKVAGMAPPMKGGIGPDAKDLTGGELLSNVPLEDDL